jgi:hypothetical protein
MTTDSESIVPIEFDVPPTLVDRRFVLEPLGPQHNERDYAAWTTSIDHLRSTPGFPWGDWPHEMTLEANRGDLEEHAADFATRRGFTYTVLDPVDGDVIGCVYIYPRRDEPGVQVRSWVRATHADLDVPLAEGVAAWLEAGWPFEHVHYAGRPDLSR